jgi:hypothetical protein
LDGGQITFMGAVEAAIAFYARREGTQGKAQWQRDHPLNSEASITNLNLRSSDGTCISELVLGDAIWIEFSIEFHKSVSHPQLGVLVHSLSGEPILDLRTRHGGPDIVKAEGSMLASMRLEALNLYPGEYLISPWVTDSSSKDLDWIENCVSLRVLPRSGPFGDMRLTSNWGKYFVASQWTLSPSTSP